MTELSPDRLTADRLTGERAAALIHARDLVLRAERKSPQTIKAYCDGLHRYLAWCAERGTGSMNRTSLNQWWPACSTRERLRGLPGCDSSPSDGSLSG